MKLQEALDYIDFNEIRSPWIMRISNKEQFIFVKRESYGNGGILIESYKGIHQYKPQVLKYWTVKRVRRCNDWQINLIHSTNLPDYLPKKQRERQITALYHKLVKEEKKYDKKNSKEIEKTI